MNKNTSMTYYFNKITDMFKQKVYVENGPLEQPKKKETEEKKFPLLKESEEAGKESGNVININSIREKENLLVMGNHVNHMIVHNQVSSEETIKSEFNLLLAEKIIEYEERIIVRIDEIDYEGHSVITDYRLIFKPNIKLLKQCIRNPFIHLQSDYFEVPLILISKIEKSTDKKNPNNYLLDIYTKDNRLIKIVNNNNSKKFFGDLVVYSSPKDSYSAFAHKYRECHPVNHNGWEVYEMIEEFQRQGVNFSEYDNHGELNYTNMKKMRLSDVNENFLMCMSYPERLIVPCTIKDEELKEAANFRTKARIPTLCYFNRENNASLWRSSQTKSGLTYQRNEMDEKLLQAIFELNPGSKKVNKLIIYDARPYLNAFANRFKGAGFENTDNYKNTEICFCEIDNIHCVRNGLQKVNALISSPKLIENKTFFANLEGTTWMNFIYQIIKSAVDVANSIRNGNSVLIHCSDGWDRSSQLTSLSQILLDPYYRTLKGFMVLIEKEWLSFGHQFGLRNGFYNLKDNSEDQRAPIFLQWLDCIHQLLFQFPHLFEFNMDLLLFLAYHLNSCKYGTFIYNSEFERKEKKAREKTVSIWTDILENSSNFINPFYDYITSNDKRFRYIIPNFSFYKLRFWEEHFLRYIPIHTHFDRIYPNYMRGNKTSDEEFEFFEEFENLTHQYYKKKNNIKSNVCSNKLKKILTNYQFIELDKSKDQSIITEQNKEIEKLNNIIKEISSKIILKVEDYHELSEEAKDYIKKLNNGEMVEEDGYVVVRKSENLSEI